MSRCIAVQLGDNRSELVAKLAVKNSDSQVLKNWGAELVCKHFHEHIFFNQKKKTKYSSFDSFLIAYS